MLRRALSSNHSILGLGTLGLPRCAVLLSVLLGSMEAGAQPVQKSTPRSCPNLEFRFLNVGDTVVAPEGFTQLFFYDANAKKSMNELSLTSGSWILQRDQQISKNQLKYASPPIDVQLAWVNTDTSPPLYCLQKFNVPSPVVNAVVCDGATGTPCMKGIGDQLAMEVYSLDAWINDVNAERKSTPETRADLVPFFNGVPLAGIHPENPMVRAERVVEGEAVTVLLFTLARNDSNKAAWNRLLNGFVWNGRPVNVSLGFESGAEIPTSVLNDPKTPEKDLNYRHFTLAVLPHGATYAAFALLAVAVVGFSVLMVTTDIVKDPAAPRRPDGERPFSLARMQMAFWFFLVASAYVLLFLTTKDGDTLTTSVLTLMGISAGTALGAAIIDAGTTVDKFRNVTTIHPDDRRASCAELDKRIEDLRKQFAARKSQAPATEEERLAKQTEERALQENLAVARQHRAFFGLPPWRVVMNDLLGDDGEISFHRFQILAWTLILGIVFVDRVLSALAMPEFSGTILGLMGVSSGTYVGFKLSPAKDAGATRAAP
jgi:hypothetical protein